MITGGDATELSQAEFTGNLTGAITLAEANSGTATFKTSGSTANTITGAITTTNSKTSQNRLKHHNTTQQVPEGVELRILKR